jgi:hypothetical protein
MTMKSQKDNEKSRAFCKRRVGPQKPRGTLPSLWCFHVEKSLPIFALENWG